jgi:hypothetical protein
MNWIEPPITDPVTIKVVGVENPKNPRRNGPSHPVRLYGHRENDAAKRLVGVEVPVNLGTAMVKEFQDLKEFPDIEVSNKKWFYVAIVGPNEMLAQQGTM